MINSGKPSITWRHLNGDLKDKKAPSGVGEEKTGFQTNAEESYQMFEKPTDPCSAAKKAKGHGK